MTKTNDTVPVSALSLFNKSKDLVLANFNTYGLLYLLPFLTALFSSIRSRNGDAEGFSDLSLNFSALTLGLGVFVGGVMGILYVVVTVATYVLNYESSKGKKPTVSELWPVMQKFGWRLVGLSVATVGVIILGLLALIVPGIIFIRRYYLAPFVMLDKDLSIGDSMRESARLSKPYSGSVWGIIGVMILLSAPSFIPVVGWLISFVLATLYAVAPALRYKELKKLS